MHGSRALVRCSLRSRVTAHLRVRPKVSGAQVRVRQATVPPNRAIQVDQDPHRLAHPSAVCADPPAPPVRSRHSDHHYTPINHGQGQRCDACPGPLRRRPRGAVPCASSSDRRASVSCADRPEHPLVRAPLLPQQEGVRSAAARATPEPVLPAHLPISHRSSTGSGLPSDACACLGSALMRRRPDSARPTRASQGAHSPQGRVDGPLLGRPRPVLEWQGLPGRPQGSRGTRVDRRDREQGQGALRCALLVCRVGRHPQP